MIYTINNQSENIETMTLDKSKTVSMLGRKKPIELYHWLHSKKTGTVFNEKYLYFDCEEFSIERISLRNNLKILERFNLITVEDSIGGRIITILK